MKRLRAVLALTPFAAVALFTAAWGGPALHTGPLSEEALSAVSPVCAFAVREVLDIQSISRCYPGERRLLYPAIPADVKTQLWRDHLQLFLAEPSHLTADQRKTVEHVLAHLDEYIGDGGAAAAERDGFTTEALISQFGLPTARAIFATLGSDVQFGGHPAGETRLMRAGDGCLHLVLSRARPGAGDGLNAIDLVPYCSCNQSHDFCCVGDCGTEFDDCMWQSSGCGWLWSQACDGLCESGPE